MLCSLLVASVLTAQVPPALPGPRIQPSAASVMVELPGVGTLPAPAGAWRPLAGHAGTRVLDAAVALVPVREGPSPSLVTLERGASGATHAACWLPTTGEVTAVETTLALAQVEVEGVVLRWWMPGPQANWNTWLAELRLVFRAWKAVRPRVGNTPLVIIGMETPADRGMAARVPFLLPAPALSTAQLTRRSPRRWVRPLALQWVAGSAPDMALDDLVNQLEREAHAALQLDAPGTTPAGATTPHVPPDALASVRSTQPAQRRDAVATLSAYALDGAVRGLLVEALQDTDAHVVMRAAEGLCGAGDENSARALGRVAGAPGDARVRVAAAAALGCHVDVAPDLVRRARALQTPDAEVEAAVVHGICRVRPDHPVLVEVLAHGTASEFMAAASCIQPANRGAALKQAWPRTMDADPRVRLSMLQLLERMDARESLPMLPALHARESDPAVRLQLHLLLDASRH